MKNIHVFNIVGIDTKRDYEKGQVLLISLFILTVAMVIGLSAATRTITTLRMSSASDSSQRAFSAAEAGIEQALTAPVSTTISGNLSNNSSFSTSTGLLLGDEFLVNSGGFLSKDDSADIWLSDYPDYTNPWTGTLKIYWGDPGDVCIASPESSNTMAALEVIIIRGSKTSPELLTYAFDPCNNRRNNSNSFSTTLAGGVVGGNTFAYSADISINSGLLVRVIPLYAGSYIGVTGLGVPPQGTVITSIGSSGGTQRKIISFRGYPKIPDEIYPFLIFSPK
jgi:hypothetical protein